MANCLLFALIFPPLKGARFVCLGRRAGRDSETEDEREEFLDNEVENDLAIVS